MFTHYKALTKQIKAQEEKTQKWQTLIKEFKENAKLKQNCHLEKETSRQKSTQGQMHKVP